MTNTLLQSLIVALFLNFFNTGSRLISQVIASISFAYVLSISCLIFFSTIIKRLTWKQLFAIYLMALLILSLVLNMGIDTMQAAKTILQLIFIAIFCFSVSRLDIKMLNISMFRKINVILASLLYVLYFMRLAGYDFMFHNIASLAHISYGMFFLNFMIRESSLRRISLCHSLFYIPLLILSKGRNMILAFILTMIIYNFWHVFSRTKCQRLLTFSSLVGAIYVITVEYPKWYLDPRFIAVDQWIRQFTGKSLFSGRQVIWRNIMPFMEGNFWFGHGTGTLYRFFLDDTRSAHNQYLQVYMQNGILGVSILVLVLWLLWSSLSRLSYHPERSMRTQSRLSGAFLLGFVFLNTFTVGMLQNSMATALLMWFIVSIGLNRSQERCNERGECFAMHNGPVYRL